MEQTWTISGVCGLWRITVGVEPEKDTEFAVDPSAAAADMASLEHRFFTVVNLIEAKTLWEPVDGLRR